ncbi:MAG: hypothetical protein P8H03_01595 [Emcibacteraceae bacterium]|nr:hypothetical protein [Emcibacteraceae bacterium]
MTKDVKKTMVVDATDQAAGNGIMSRRFFLNSALATGATLATGNSAFAQEASVGENQEEWTLMPGETVPEYGDVSSFEKGRVKKFVAPPTGGATASVGGRTPLHLLQGTITPSGLHLKSPITVFQILILINMKWLFMAWSSSLLNGMWNN